MSPILILFESGNLAEVRVTLYKAPGERSRLLDAYVTTECEGSVTRSARRAAEAVLNWLPEEHRPKVPMVAGFDLSGLSTERPITGESGGLAFAIALVAELTGKDAGPLAATGILANSSARSSILPVKGLSAKINAAIGALPAGSQVFIPEGNSGECDEKTKKVAQDKGIAFNGTSSLDDSLNAIFGTEAPKNVRIVKFYHNKGPLVGVCTLSILLIFMVGFLSLRGGDSQRPKVTVNPSPIKALSVKASLERVKHIDGTVTLWVTTPEEKAVAPILSKKLLEHLETVDVFNATLQLDSTALPQGLSTIEATLSNVTLQRGGNQKLIEVAPISIVNTDAEAVQDSLLADLLVTNLITVLPRDIQNVSTDKKPIGAETIAIPAGKGFD